MPTTDGRPHMLYVAWAFPPARTGGVYRALATANEFAARGWHVTVLAADPDAIRRYRGIDPSLEERIDPRIDVVHVPFSWPIRDTDVRTYSLARVFLGNEAWGRRRAAKDRRTYPESVYGSWRPAVTKAALAVHAHRPVDLTIATANPHVDFHPAYELQRLHGVPYVMDYRDAWRLDVFGGGTVHSATSRVGRLEAAYVERAKEIWLVNEPIRAWHRAEYPAHADRMRVVENGWDPTFLADRAPARRPEAGRPLRFGYLGTMTAKVPLDALMRGWVLAKERGLIDAEATLSMAGYLGDWSTPSREVQAAFAAAQDAGVSFVGQVPKGTVADFYGGLDVLVLALGEGRYVTSGKVYEYMATGRTILSVHAPTNHSTQVLRDYPLWAAVADLGDDAVATALGRASEIARGATDDQLRAAFDAGTAVRRDRQLDDRVSALTEEFTR